MKRRALVLALIAVPAFTSAAAQAAPAPPEQPAAPLARPHGGTPGGSRNSYANPSAVIAAELAFAQDAQVRGQWTAFAAAAAPDAVMFTPGMVWAQQWLKGRPNPAAAVKWQPQEVWSSCDGSVMVSHGAWQKAGPGKPEIGYFTTIWQRQPDGRYKWILDHGDTLEAPVPVPEMLAAHVADCPDRPTRPEGPPPKGKSAKAKPVKLANLPPLDPYHRAGAATDGSLKWEVTVDRDGGRKLAVSWMNDGEERDVLNDEVGAYLPAE